MSQMTREDLPETLRKLALFNVLDERALRALSAIVRIEEYNQGEALIQQGSPSNGVYILLQGSIKVSMQTSTGAIVVLDSLDEGSVFGTLAAIDRKQRGASCTAKDAVVVGRIAMLDFQDLMYGSSSLALGFQIVILRSIFQELRKTNAQLSELSALSAVSI